MAHDGRAGGRPGLCASVRQVAGHDLACGARAQGRGQRVESDRGPGILRRARTQAGVEKHGPFKRHAANAFEILEGDAFDLTPELLGPVQAAYDRAALVSLPPQLRAAYVESFARLMSAGTRLMLVAFEYPQKLKEGPPFSVEPDRGQRALRRDVRNTGTGAREHHCREPEIRRGGRIGAL